MKHPAILLLPLFMFADYYLTILGAIWSEKSYAAHFKVEHYELNPLWQKTVQRKRWFNLKHVLLTVIVTTILALALQFELTPDFLADGVMGCLFVFFGAAIGRHVSNLLTFWRYSKYPGEVSGQVRLSHSRALAISSFQYLVMVIPVAIIAIFNPSPFTIGGVLGAGMLLFVHALWAIRSKKNPVAATKKETGPQPLPAGPSD